MPTINEMANRQMDTISTVLNRLKRRNQDNEFVITENGELTFNGKSYSQHDIKIIKTYRFEGESDPADEAKRWLCIASEELQSLSIGINA